MSDVRLRERLRPVGLDVGDRHTQVCVLDGTGAVIEEARLATTAAALTRRFGGVAPVRAVLEAGTHSPWISRLLAEAGHEVIVANPRRVRLISQNDNKTARADAETRARLGRVDPALLAPVRHRVPAARGGERRHPAEHAYRPHGSLLGRFAGARGGSQKRGRCLTATRAPRPGKVRVASVSAPGGLMP